jgi:GTPase SAR1 family protein
MKGEYRHSERKILTLKKHHPLFKIVTVGDSEVGKTTFINAVVV